MPAAPDPRCQPTVGRVSARALKQRIFLELAIGAAYTPLSLGPDGKIYSLNAGHLFVVGE